MVSWFSESLGHAWYFVTPACIIILNGHVSSERFLDCACSEEDSREVFVGILVMEACCDELCVIIGYPSFGFTHECGFIDLFYFLVAHTRIAQQACEPVEGSFVPIFHSHRVLAEGVGINDVCSPGVEDVCNAGDTNLFQGEGIPEVDPELLLGVEWVRDNFSCQFPKIINRGIVCLW